MGGQASDGTDTGGTNTNNSGGTNTNTGGTNTGGMGEAGDSAGGSAGSGADAGGLCGTIAAAPGKLEFSGTQNGGPVSVNANIFTSTPRFGHTVIGNDPQIAEWGSLNAAAGIAIKNWMGSGTYSGVPDAVEVRVEYPISGSMMAGARNQVVGDLTGVCSVCTDYDELHGSISGTLTCTDLLAFPPITEVTGSFRTELGSEGICGRVLGSSLDFEIHGQGIDTSIFNYECKSEGGKFVLSTKDGTPLLEFGPIAPGQRTFTDATFSFGPYTFVGDASPTELGASDCNVCWDAADHNGRYYCASADKTTGETKTTIEVLGEFRCP